MKECSNCGKSNNVLFPEVIGAEQPKQGDYEFSQRRLCANCLPSKSEI